MRSLWLRLWLVAMAAIFIALAVAWFAMTLIFQRHVQRRLEDDLQRAGVELVAALSLAPGQAPTLDSVPLDRRYGEPASGLYWQVTTPGGVIRSRSLWDQSLPTAPPGPRDWRARLVRGPYEPAVLVMERRVHPDGAGEVLIQTAENAASLTTARDEFGRELALFLLLLWGVLSAAAWAQVRVGLRPLGDVRREVEGLRDSAAARVGGVHPGEVQPLVDAINALADAREAELQRARRRAGDLAHSLKTPLSALSAQSRRAREAGAVAAADGLDHAIAAVASAVDAELTRARIAAVRRQRCDAGAVIERLVAVLERTEAGDRIVIEVDPSSRVDVPLAEDDLAELLGPLIENAVRHARRHVRIRGHAGDGVRLAIEDDGPGLSADRAARVIAQGGRLDETGGGHGFGLSIARDLAEATGGRLELSPAALGGLQAAVVWPPRAGA